MSPGETYVSRLAAVALSAAVALPGDVAVGRTDVSASAACDTETKRLNKFKRGMKVAQRRYFKTHRSRKARARLREGAAP